MKILIVSGSLGKYFHLKQFGEALKKMGDEYKLVNESEYGLGFPSKNIKDWFNGGKKFKMLINDFSPDCVFVDIPARVGLYTIKAKIPLFVLMRGHYWSEIDWAKKTIIKGPVMRLVLWIRKNTAEKCFREATAVFPICEWLCDVVKEHHPNQKTHAFLEGIDASKWYQQEGLKLKHPCVGLLQNANWWGKAKEMLTLKNVLKEMKDVHFYWVGELGPYTEKILEELKEFENFHWVGPLQYPDEVRKYLSAIDVYALVTGMDTAPLTLKEAQLMEKPVVATDVGGISEMMDDKKSGFLINEGDSKGLIEKLTVLLNDKSKAEQMGKEGRKFVMDNFNWDKIADNFLEIVKKYV